MEYRELLLEYADALRTDLTWASKSHITALTMLAAENKGAAASICATIERHILSVPPATKIPALYLVDSIVKNVKEPYIGLFSRNLSQIFLDIWRHRELHPQLLKLLGMWNGIFPNQLLEVLQRTVKQTSPAQTSGRQNVPPSHYQAFNLPAQQQWRPAETAYPLYTASAAGTSGRDPYAAVQQQAYGSRSSTPPASVHCAAPVNAYPAHANFTSQGGAVPQAWQPQFPVQQGQYTAPLPSTCQPLVLPSLLSSLMNSGLLTAQQPAPSAAVATLSAAPVLSHSQPSSRAATPEFVDPEDAKFVPSRLKEHNQVTQDVLMANTAQLRSKHLDMQFMRRRRQRSLVGATRQWFVNADLWLAGTAAAAVGEAATLETQEPDVPVEAASVLVDDAQPRCAISGEKFEVFWHEQHQEWRYKNAVRLDEDVATQHGLQPGALVLSSTLSGLPALEHDVLAAEQQSPVQAETDTSRLETGLQEAAMALQNTGYVPASTSGLVGQKRPADLAEAPSTHAQLHIDKRVKLEV